MYTLALGLVDIKLVLLKLHLYVIGLSFESRMTLYTQRRSSCYRVAMMAGKTSSSIWAVHRAFSHKCCL